MNSTTTQKETFESRDFFNKAKIDMKRGDFKSASLRLEEALKISPHNAEYLSALGLCVSMQGNAFAGERMCRKALAVSTDKVPELYVNLGRVLLDEGNRKEARALFTLAYKMDNTNAPAALELSRMGVRKRPVLRFLERNHPLNVLLGQIRHKIIEFRRPELKKL
ncbi:MAG: tetratricopeptide repeat protein [Candidatus Krumholzibacteriota bacterium]|nr:tetratricopeptide repeat protein [Candidatus Krumholzibacteriota bacterium]